MRKSLLQPDLFHILSSLRRRGNRVSGAKAIRLGAKSTLSPLLMAVIGLTASCGFVRANDIYIAQAAAGANNGQNCSGAYASTFFNSASNWGSGAAKIGPGTTVHVCGSWSGTAGVTYLTFHGSGIAGNPITLLFETGANMRQPYCGSSGGGCINVNNQGYITIDGGLNTPCGASNGGGAAANTCNGYIQNTLNGTSGGVCPGGTCQYQASS